MPIDKTPYQLPATAFKPGTVARFVDIRTGQIIPGRRYFIKQVRNDKTISGHEIRDPYPSLCGPLQKRPDGTWTYMACCYEYSYSGKVPRVVPTDEVFSHEAKPIPALTP
jgi:hypothetical protein